MQATRERGPAPKWHEPLSYNLLTGSLKGRCHKHVVLPAQRLEALILGCETLGVDKMWAAAVADQAEDQRRASSIINIGFRNAVCMALSRCKTGNNVDTVAQMYGLGDFRDVGVLFPVTVLAVNEFLKATVCVVPDLCQLDKDKLPAFDDPEFSNVMMTLDATNLVIDTPHNPSGNKHSNSEYYGGCHFKFELCSDITGCVACLRRLPWAGCLRRVPAGWVGRQGLPGWAPPASRMCMHAKHAHGMHATMMMCMCMQPP